MKINLGRKGELLFQRIMQERGYQVKDVSNNPDYWYKDIDFIITSPTTQQTKTFEVKWDSRINQTGNLYIELSNVNSRGGLGWFEFCEAELLAYGDACAECFYIIPVDKLREKIAQNNYKIGRCGCESTGLLIKLEEIKDILYIL